MISSSTNRITYNGDGSTKSFPYGFLILADTDLQVMSTNTTTGVQTPLTLTTDYGVTGAGTGSGLVMCLTAPASGTTLTIRRVMPRTQSVDYVENDKFPASTHELALDKLTMIAQEMDTAYTRTLRQPTGDANDLDPIPAAGVRANKYLGFDASGNLIAGLPTGSTPTSVYGAGLVTSADATAARSTLGIPLTAFPSTTFSNGATFSSTVTVSANVENTGTGYFDLPAGTTAQRPAGANGNIRYNTTTAKYEGYSGSAWGQLGGGATGGGSDAVFMENDQTVNNDYTISANRNAVSAGPVSIASGKTVTIPSGSVWTVV
jgi:hypothetical protein